MGLFAAMAAQPGFHETWFRDDADGIYEIAGKQFEVGSAVYFRQSTPDLRIRVRPSFHRHHHCT